MSRTVGDVARGRCIECRVLPARTIARRPTPTHPLFIRPQIDISDDHKTEARLGVAAGATARVDAAFPIEPRTGVELFARARIHQFRVVPGDETAVTKGDRGDAA